MGDKSPKAKEKMKKQGTSDKSAKKAPDASAKAAPIMAAPAKKGK